MLEDRHYKRRGLRRAHLLLLFAGMVFFAILLTQQRERGSDVDTQDHENNKKGEGQGMVHPPVGGHSVDVSGEEQRPGVTEAAASQRKWKRDKVIVTNTPETAGAGDFKMNDSASFGLLPVTPLESNLMQFEGISSGSSTTASFKQLHHGVYRVLSSESQVQYALKTECRPAAKWHGQQGWPEVATYHFAKILFRQLAPRVMVPYARGVVATASKTQLRTTVHSDQCGVVSVDLLDAAFSSSSKHLLGASGTAKLAEFLTAKSKKSEDGVASKVFLIGVGLVWQDTHDDSAFPSKNLIVQAFSPPSPSRSKMVTSKKGTATITALGSAAQREEVSSISDILVLDYLLGNPDREEKNWFTVSSAGGHGVGGGGTATTSGPSKKRIAMDNGWMFAGPDYTGSVCGLMEEQLLCPPVFRILTKNKRCDSVRNCRFRNSTVETIFDLGKRRHQWATSASGEWTNTLAQDPLIVFLLRTFSTRVERKKRNLPYSTALARYIHGCSVEESDTGGESPHPPPLIASPSSSFTTAELLGFLSQGISLRLAKLESHIEKCLAEYGETYVLI